MELISFGLEETLPTGKLSPSKEGGGPVRIPSVFPFSAVEVISSYLEKPTWRNTVGSFGDSFFELAERFRWANQRPPR